MHEALLEHAKAKNLIAQIQSMNPVGGFYNAKDEQGAMFPISGNQMNNNGVIRIGTSGIVLPGKKADFPDAFKSGTRLHYYGSLFDTLEINSSFYRIPLPSTFAKWVTEVPEYFKFTIKLWRNITHVDKLDFKREDIEVFMRSISYVDNKSGCILIQFPHAIGVSYKEKVEQIPPVSE